MNATLIEPFYLIPKDNQLFSYTKFVVKKINVGIILNYEKSLFYYSSYQHSEIRKVQGVTMAIPHHTYLIMKMPTPNGILSVLGNIMVSYNCESATVELSKDSAVSAAATVMVAQAAQIDQTTLEVPEQKRTSTALDPSPAVKKVCLGLPDTSKEVVIGANVDPK
jgi:hypothetical protein